MTRNVLLAGVATALALAPTAAFASTDGNYDPFTFENHVSTSLYTTSFQFDATGIIGGVLLHGTIDPDSAASAITDAKQLQSDEAVTFTGTLGDLLTVGGAEVDNDADSGAVSGNGNIGVNVAAGQYNMQQNSANIAVSADPSTEADGGWASASTTGYQSLTGTSYGPGEISVTILGYFTSPYSDDNDATSAAVTSNGNVGVNVAAGAFNQQQNLLTLAVANDSVLSQSNAALWQTASCNSIDIQDQDNEATSGAITGNGNIGVNIAAGVGNQQQNSLTAAVSNPSAGTGM
jgi:hypothetical protein